MEASFNYFLQSKVSLRSLELITVDIPQKEVFRSAIGARQSRKALIVKWTNANDVVGWGECSCRPDPFYSHEFVEGAVEVIENFIFPLLFADSTYGEMLASMQKVRGWHFTKAAIEFAMNDCLRRETGRGIIESSGWPTISQVPVGISMGLFDSVTQLESKLAEVANLSYQRLKFKISPEYINQKIIDHLATIDHANISFDANGSFTPESFELLSKYAGQKHTIEQPFPPTEIHLYEQYLQNYDPFSICLDEDIESYGNLVNLASNMQEVNIKPGRVGGLYTTLRMIDYCQKNELAAWIGGMFETGIGRAQNLQLAALLPEAKAHDLSPSSRYFAKDVLVNPIVMHNGFIDKSNFAAIKVDEIALYEMTIERRILRK